MSKCSPNVCNKTLILWFVPLEAVIIHFVSAVLISECSTCAVNSI